MEIRNCTSDDGSVCEWEVRGGAERACAHDYSELCVRDFERLKAEVERLERENIELTEELGRRVIKMESERKRKRGG